MCAVYAMGDYVICAVYAMGDSVNLDWFCLVSVTLCVFVSFSRICLFVCRCRCRCFVFEGVLI